jgi:hypothetical protein
MCLQSQYTCRQVHVDEEGKWCPECWEDLFEEARLFEKEKRKLEKSTKVLHRK